VCVYIVFINEIDRNDKNYIYIYIYIYVPFAGVEAASLKGNDKDQIEVKGEGIDTVKLTTLIRKKVGHADIVSVKEDKKEEKKPEAVQVLWPYVGGVPSYPIYQEDPCSTPCSIM
jgi:hypothetical protein